MEFRREPLITAFNFTFEYQEQNGVNSGSVVPVMVFILNRVNRRWANAQFVKLNQCSVLWLFSCWSISEYIWSLMANFFFFSVLSSNCSSSLGYESVDSSVKRSSYRPCSRASSRNSGLLVIKSSFRLSAFVISISVSLLSKIVYRKEKAWFVRGLTVVTHVGNVSRNADVNQASDLNETPISRASST